MTERKRNLRPVRDVTAPVAMNDALTAYQASDQRIYSAAREVGISDEEWFAVKCGTVTIPATVVVA